MRYFSSFKTKASDNIFEHKSSVAHVWFFWLALSVVSLFGSSGLLNEFYTFGLLVTAFINVFAIYHSRFFPPLTFILLFNFLVTFYAIPHFFFEVSIVNIPARDGLPYLTQALWNSGLFFSVFMVWLTSIKRDNRIDHAFTRIVSKLQFPKSPVIFNILISIILVATTFGIRGAFVLGVDDGYSSYVDNLQGASGLQEYLLVLFFISGALIKTRLQKIVWFIVLAIFVVKLSLVGLRIVALMGLLLGLWFSGARVSIKQTIIVFVSGFFLMSLLGLLKSGSFDLANLFFELHGDNFVSHHGNVLWASTAMLQLIDRGVIDFSIRFDLLAYYSLNSLIPSGLLQEFFGQSYFGSWLQENGYTSGGGHAATYLYVAGGSLSIVLVSSLWGFAFKVATSSNTSSPAVFLRCLFLMTLITFPRWISYDIGNFLFRLPIYTSLITVFIIALKPNLPRNFLKTRHYNA
jgi:hypothetical protein